MRGWQGGQGWIWAEGVLARVVRVVRVVRVEQRRIDALIDGVVHWRDFSRGMKGTGPNLKLTI